MLLFIGVITETLIWDQGPTVPNAKGKSSVLQAVGDEPKSLSVFWFMFILIFGHW